MRVFNQLSILIRREFWEHRNTFVILPAVITGFFLAMLLLALIASNFATVSMSDEDIGFLGQPMESGNLFTYVVEGLGRLQAADRAAYLNQGLQIMVSPLMLVWWFVSFFYLLGALFEDRRDRSVLFWKSLPVSDSLTVISKLVTAVIAVPMVYLAGAALLQFSALLLLTFSALGTELSLWDTIWGPASLLGRWFGYLGLLLFYALWCLPFFAWLLAVSAFAKSIPLVWAIGLPIALIITERILTRDSILADWMSNHVVPLQMFDGNSAVVESVAASLLSFQFVIALAVGAALIGLAIWLRGKADEL